MEPFCISHEEFWEWFHKDKQTVPIAEPTVKKIKTRHEQAVDISAITQKRYICLYGKHRPGKKVKVWEGDGYLSITSNNIAHLSDLRGRLLEEPEVLEEINLESGDEIQIGDMEVQIVDLDET
uniref:5'-3' DNA helicase ZGRF1-like N-terminal domain-containing protein n=1 Tax=Aceria tosichella TaxID=561515 RepID=A0A6G1S6V8_9ACAR